MPEKKDIVEDVKEEKKQYENTDIESKIDKVLNMLENALSTNKKDKEIEIPEVPKEIEVEQVEEIETEKDDIIVEVGTNKKTLGYYINKFLVG